ncbi:hypothetical protein KJ068_07620 [bacterium]|nr:hypothetical protein [bacterium]
MKFWLHFDTQAQHGDLRRIQILTSDELSLERDLRGPFHKSDDAVKIAESLMWDAVARTLERLRNENPHHFATFLSAGQAAEE